MKQYKFKPDGYYRSRFSSWLGENFHRKIGGWIINIRFVDFVLNDDYQSLFKDACGWDE